ncbi:60S acidic ribosomal protein P0 [Homalodisca vitripennis]|nr:60S acidic ribosomal protein P0 [Homalodisca vitripennis]
MQQIRMSLRGTAVVLIGKNNVMFKAIRGMVPSLHALSSSLRRTPDSDQRRPLSSRPCRSHQDLQRTIEIINKVHILKEGDNSGTSKVTLLNMLNISTFSYGLLVEMVYDSGTVFKSKILDFKPEDVRIKFMEYNNHFISLVVFNS